MKTKFAQPDEDTPFGRHLKEITRYLNIGIPSFIGTYNATLPKEELLRHISLDVVLVIDDNMFAD